MRIVGTWDPKEITDDRKREARTAILAAYEAGYTLFDHADIYCRGECERVFGDVMREVKGMRDRILIATKCGIRFAGDTGPGAPHRFDFSREHILWSCDESLKRLRVETIDVYQLHRPDVLCDPHEVAGAFETLKKQGKVREFGVSNFPSSTVTMLQKFLPSGMPLVVNQVRIHLGDLACFNDGTLDQCITETITPLAWSPVGGGFLGTGGVVNEKDPRREVLTKLQAAVDEVAKERGVSRTVISLAWLLKHPSKIIPIVGSCKPDHIKDAAKADDVELTREEWYRLNAAARAQPLP
jgi:predicted oxidoreductase